MNSVAHTFVVSDGIADWYRKVYPSHTVSVVRNAPTKSEVKPALTACADAPLRRFIGATHSDVVFLYQGVLGPARGIPPMLAAFQDPPPGHILAVMGYGPLEPSVADAAAEFPAIHHVPVAAPDKVVEWAIGADVGLATGEHAGLSYELSMPNKLLRYLACEIPTLVNDLPEMARFVTEQPVGPVGWVAAPTPIAMTTAVASIDLCQAKVRKKRLAGWIDTHSWEREASDMLRHYARLGFAPALGISFLYDLSTHEYPRSCTRHRFRLWWGRIAQRCRH